MRDLLLSIALALIAGWLVGVWSVDDPQPETAVPTEPVALTAARQKVAFLTQKVGALEQELAAQQAVITALRQRPVELAARAAGGARLARGSRPASAQRADVAASWGTDGSVTMQPADEAGVVDKETGRRYMPYVRYRPYRPYRPFLPYTQQHLGSLDDCSQHPNARECLGTQAHCAIDGQDAACHGTRAYCESLGEFLPQDELCVGTAVFCAAQPQHPACRGTQAGCAAKPAHAACAGTEAFCADAAGDRRFCRGTKAYCHAGDGPVCDTY